MSGESDDKWQHSSGVFWVHLPEWILTGPGPKRGPRDASGPDRAGPFPAGS